MPVPGTGRGDILPKGTQGGDSRCRTLVTEVLDAQSSWITLVSRGLETSTCCPRVLAQPGIHICIYVSLIVHVCICCPRVFVRTFQLNFMLIVLDWPDFWLAC